MRIVVCSECKRRFDLMDEVDAQDWYYGHDCEPPHVPDNAEQIPDVSGFNRGPEDG